jgi:hypothetical protein
MRVRVATVFATAFDEGGKAGEGGVPGRYDFSVWTAGAVG